VSVTLILLADAYSVVQYPLGTMLAPPRKAALWNVTLASDEVSLVCATKDVPSGAQQQADGWRGFRFEGPFDFALTGILVSVAVPLAAANIGIFALSTYNTDYLLVQAAQLEAAVTSLRQAGHIVVTSG
jgi:uncharacterized protein